MKKPKRSTLFLLYFFMLMLMFLMSAGCCSSDDSDNDDKGSASGIWGYHSVTDMNAITIIWRSVDFPCNGPTLGEETVRVTITDTTMTWEDDVIRWILESGTEGETVVTWTRESGTAGDPVGTWTTTGEGGSTYELEIGDDGTVSVSGDNLLCSSSDT